MQFVQDVKLKDVVARVEIYSTHPNSGNASIHIDFPLTSRGEKYRDGIAKLLQHVEQKSGLPTEYAANKTGNGYYLTYHSPHRVWTEDQRETFTGTCMRYLMATAAVLKNTPKIGIDAAVNQVIALGQDASLSRIIPGAVPGAPQGDKADAKPEAGSVRDQGGPHEPTWTGKVERTETDQAAYEAAFMVIAAALIDNGMPGDLVKDAAHAAAGALQDQGLLKADDGHGKGRGGTGGKTTPRKPKK